MGGPYGYDIEFALVITGLAFIFLIVSAIIEAYIEWKRK
jgi:hypothetical protein